MRPRQSSGLVGSTIGAGAGAWAEGRGAIGVGARKGNAMAAQATSTLSPPTASHLRRDILGAEIESCRSHTGGRLSAAMGFKSYGRRGAPRQESKASRRPTVHKQCGRQTKTPLAEEGRLRSGGGRGSLRRP